MLAILNPASFFCKKNEQVGKSFMIKSLHTTQRRFHMFHTHSILNLIGIKDKNIHIEEDYFKSEVRVLGESLSFTRSKAVLQAPSPPL